MDGFYSITEAGSAFCYYHRKDGKVTALWKRSLCAISEDGIHFSKPVKSPTFIMAGGKMWGQSTKDGRYAGADIGADGQSQSILVGDLSGSQGSQDQYQGRVAGLHHHRGEDTDASEQE